MTPQNGFRGSHNPKVAGSNPAPLLAKGPLNEGPCCSRSARWRISSEGRKEPVGVVPILDAQQRLIVGCVVRTARVFQGRVRKVGKHPSRSRWVDGRPGPVDPSAGRLLGGG